MDTLPLLIPGAEPPAGTLNVYNPFDLSEIGRLATGDSRHVEQALTTACGLFRNRDSWLPLDQRIDIFSRLLHRLSGQQEDLARQAAAEGGKPLVDSRIEISRAMDGIKLCIDCMRNDSGSMPVVNSTGATRHHLAFTTKEPVGVVVAVSAFNHPFNLIVHQVGPALAAGCPVIVKPADDTPLSCWHLAKLFHESGLPPEWLQVLIPESLAVAEHLVTARRVGFFSFIGSARVGWSLRSKLAAGTRCALEHGGAAPVIVAADADVDLAVRALAKGGFYHAGQVCVSSQRVYVHQSISQAFLRGLKKAADDLTVGDPLLDNTDVGPLIRPAEVDRVEAWVNEARAGGGTIVCGGRRVGRTGYAPTIIHNPPVDARVSEQEIFGPVVCVYDYETLDYAIEQANRLPFAFQAAVFSEHQPTILRAYKRLDASAIMVNQHTAFRSDGMPFAGLKQSGLGVGGIFHTFSEMQVNKMMVVHSPEL
ncbi:aldehyde dehydrogenase family protein [Endozoicomonas euniceicola]|uniref:Aldehyde dehydrogenase family protein n=1 Tax=Endozoicomonas euniceicola TaxID=1234143 RepID=A0ABY6GSK8_9GAMM|nr:aldehyde dehydrogenase family protein [Endozoicomonas euniceicola]UYM15738.1 aldehyde dehydrogenase family protein [Endozoicomonas euniceicola]